MADFSATQLGYLSATQVMGNHINNQWIVGASDVNGTVYQYTDLANATYDFAARYASALAAGQAMPMTTVQS